MKEFENEQERFNAYYKEISKNVVDLLMGILDDSENVTIINIIELLIKVESIENRNLRIKFLKEFKRSFMEQLGEKFNVLLKQKEDEDNNGNEAN